MKHFFLFGLGLFAWHISVVAEIRLPHLISDGMVIQRGHPVSFWGWAEPDETIRVGFLGSDLTTQASPDGRWEVEFPPAEAGGPHTVTIIGENVITLEDVLVGDVWIASGQSNMELSMSRVSETYPDEMAAARYPEVRYFEVGKTFDFNRPQEDVSSGKWQATTPETVATFSAVCYFFGKEIHGTYDVPVGIINAAIGGTPAESWMSEEALSAFPEALSEGKRFRDAALVEQVEARNQTIQDDWYQQLDDSDGGLSGDLPWYDPDYEPSDWKEMELPGFWDERGLEPMNGVVWFRKTITIPESLAGREARLDLGTIVDADTAYLNGQRVGQTSYQYPPRRYNVPAGVLRAGENVVVIRAVSNAGRGAFVVDKPYMLIVGAERFDLTGKWSYRIGARSAPIEPTVFIGWKPLGRFNAMIAPLTRHPVKGVIWYQGESNAGRPGNYFDLMSSLISDWRERWGQPDLPFIYMQLANFMAPADGPEESGWAEIRDAQRRLLELPHTGMAVAIDLGEWNDIHPENKEDVGRRLALAARKVAYGERDLVASGPLFESISIKGGEAVVDFRSVGGGLVTTNAGALGGFTIAGADGRYFPAEARIDGDRVVVWSEAVAEPLSVRYAWANNPVDANLANEEGLPASPFEATTE